MVMKIKNFQDDQKSTISDILGQIISGKFGEICMRQKSGASLELGELVIAENDDIKVLLQVYDLLYGSQISQLNLELISGMHLEKGENANFMSPELRNYKLSMLKNILTIHKKDAKSSKVLPEFFSKVRIINEDDLDFLVTPKNPLFVGLLRSGSKTLNVPISLPGEDVLSHHILIPATTGKGKSNLLRVLLWNSLDKDYCGFLVLDPHDEYYGRTSFGLKDHPSNNIIYYTSKEVPPGQRTLKINLKDIQPSGFQGATHFSDAQSDFIHLAYKQYKNNWIQSILTDQPIQGGFQEATIEVVKRKLANILNIKIINGEIIESGIFSQKQGSTTINDIVSALENGKTVIIDTSSFSGSIEILIGSLISSKIMNKYQYYSTLGELKNKPVISIVLEEAPRVLGKEVLEKGPNIFSRIAREGRKFKIGLIAITQLPSLIPREILANMNTKIILGIEMSIERSAIIDSAAQDLSSDNRTIASLDKGEAIITSNFSRFATPIKIPFFPEMIKEELKEVKVIKKDYSIFTS